jgi:hypothetical protein
MTMTQVVQLNEKGQCPACLKKPRPYRRQNMFACLRCGREFNMETRVQQANYFWSLDENGKWKEKSSELSKFNVAIGRKPQTIC